MRAQNDIKIAYFRDNLRFGLRLDFVRPETHSFAPASSFGFFHLFVYCVYNGIADSRLNGFLDFFLGDRPILQTVRDVLTDEVEVNVDPLGAAKVERIFLLVSFAYHSFMMLRNGMKSSSPFSLLVDQGSELPDIPFLNG